MELNSGEVIVETIGDDLKMVYTAYGNTVGLGQRMEQLTTPDQLYHFPFVAFPHRMIVERRVR